MDLIDGRILMLLQEDATLSIADISRQVGLSATPCWKRIQKLEADGIITGRVALLSPEKIGLGLTVFVSIETGDHSADWHQRNGPLIKAFPEVMEFHRMAGDIDYLLRVVVADMRAFDAFYKKLVATVPLKNVSSRFSMERIKAATALPIAGGKPARP